MDDPEAAGDDLAAGRLRILNRDYDFGKGPFWREVEQADLPPLVRETIHYHRFLFFHLRDQGREGLKLVGRLLEEWIDLHPPGRGPAWNSFTVAYRSQVWIRLCLADETGELSKRLAPHLFRHGLYLERNLESHLGGNHLLKDLSALLMLSTWFEGPTAERWRERCLPLLQSELNRQVLPDGGHYERSPMYHILVLGDLLDLRDLLAPVEPVWVESILNPAIRRMAEFLGMIVHPDGEIPFFNDAVLGKAPPPSKVFERTGQSPPQPGLLDGAPDVGLFRISSGELTLIFDAGELGPDELMGHVHNDSLSFELSMGGDRWIVNRGVYEYTPGPRRTLCRSIHSHNTPCLDGVEQSEIWSSFRVARRWHPDQRRVRLEGESAAVLASWVRPGTPRIVRAVSTIGPGRMEIEDRFEGTGRRQLSSPLFFAPGVCLAKMEDSSGPAAEVWRAEREGRRIFIRLVLPPELEVQMRETVRWPRFYFEEPIQSLVITGEFQAPGRLVITLSEGEFDN